MPVAGCEDNRSGNSDHAPSGAVQFDEHSGNLIHDQAPSKLSPDPAGPIRSASAFLEPV